MREFSKLRLSVVTALFGFALLGTFNTESDAQTKRRPKPKTGIVRTQPTPVQTMPEIISRADDFQNETQVVEPTVTQDSTVETTEEKLDKSKNRVKELNARIKSLEANQKDAYEEKQKRLMLNLDILTRAEQRAETLRKQMFEMVEKENTIKIRLDNIESDVRPEMIERQVAFSGSLRPEELRDQRRKSLEVEKRNLQNLLIDIQNSRANLEVNVQKADSLVEKLRFKVEKDIDDSLAADEANPE